MSDTYRDKVEKTAMVRVLEDKRRALAADQTSDRATVTRLLNSVDEAIRQLESEISRCAESLPLSRPGPRDGTAIRMGGGYELRSPGQSKGYRELFGNGGYQWPDRNTNFFSALLSGRHHEGLITRSMTEGLDSSGGFLVPSETAAQIHAVALESELCLPRCFVQPMRTNELKIPAMVIGSHASSLHGGFTASFVSETGTITENNPTTRMMTLVARKLVGYLRFSSELSADIPGGFDQIIQIVGKGLGWYRDKYLLNGVGGAEPLGILNSPCVVTVAKESGQGKTVQYENIVKMMSRLFAGSFKNAVWVAHNTCIPSLLQLSVSVGTGGSVVPMVTESNGTFKLMTKEIIFSEKVPKLGDPGDIMLVDFSQFVCGIREEFRFETSIAPYFSTDEIVARLVTRFDFQSLWSEPLTLADGSTTVGPVVILGAR